MNEQQRLFLAQAQSAFAVFEILRADKRFHHCHALHYLQMATELLSKASAWKSGRVGRSHKGLVTFLKNLSSNSKAQEQLGYGGKNSNWSHTIRKSYQIAERIQQLAPNLAGDGPNPEYPWPPAFPAIAPAEFTFPIWKELTEQAHGRAFLGLISSLFLIADQFL